jgi:hypothetical protein
MYNTIGLSVVYIDTGSPVPNIASKSRGLADENNKLLTNGNDSMYLCKKYNWQLIVKGIGFFMKWRHDNVIKSLSHRKPCKLVT